jgi:hypothetical protein
MDGDWARDREAKKGAKKQGDGKNPCEAPASALSMEANWRLGSSLPGSVPI